MFAQLFIRSVNSIDGVTLDAVISESHSSEVSLTTNPVQATANVVDHARVEPKSLTIVGVVTNTPFNSDSIGSRVVNSTSNLFGDSSDSNQTRIALAYKELILKQNNRELVTVQTRLESYSDMIITKVDTVTDEDNYNIATLIIKLDEAIIVNPESTTLTADQLQAGKITEQGTPQSDKGSVSPETPSDNTETSILETVARWLD